MKYIRIASCYISISDELDLLSEAINYRPFQQEAIPAADFLFRFDVDTTIVFPATSLLSTYNNEHGEYTVSYYAEVYYWQLQRKGDPHTYTMKLDLKHREASINFKVTDTETYYAANDFLRFAFIYASAAFNTLLLHASCITYQGQGIAFVGRSGIGKSTHSSLWLNHIPGAELLNDDQPAVRIQHGMAMIYGTPWSGKVPCYRSAQVPLRAILCMKQAKENRLSALSQTALFTQLLPSCSLMKADRHTLPQIINTLSNLTGCVRGAVLENYPSREAVTLSSRFLTHSIFHEKEI